MSSSELLAALGARGDLSDAELQDLMSVAVRLYAERVERAGDIAVVKPQAITATHALVTTTALLRAVNVQTFELGLWQAWAH